MMLGTKVLDCHHRKDRNIKLKELKRKKGIWLGKGFIFFVYFFVLCVASVTLILRFISTFWYSQFVNCREGFYKEKSKIERKSVVWEAVNYFERWFLEKFTVIYIILYYKLYYKLYYIINTLWIYSLSTLENTDENRILFVRSPHHKHFGKAQHLVLWTLWWYQLFSTR